MISPDIALEKVDDATTRVTLEHGIAFPVCEVSSLVFHKTFMFTKLTVRRHKKYYSTQPY